MKLAVPCLGVAVLALTPWVGAQAPATAKAPTVTRIDSTATLDGKPIEVYRLANGHGLELEAMTYGGIIRSLKVPDRSGTVADVVLGFDTPQGYLSDSPPPYFGALIGRYGNRIAKGHFTVDGQAYTLAINNAPNALCMRPPREAPRGTVGATGCGDSHSVRCLTLDLSPSGQMRARTPDSSGVIPPRAPAASMARRS